MISFYKDIFFEIHIVWFSFHTCCLRLNFTLNFADVTMTRLPEKLLIVSEAGRFLEYVFTGITLDIRSR